jgi:hypothetical protein
MIPKHLGAFSKEIADVSLFSIQVIITLLCIALTYHHTGFNSRDIHQSIHLVNTFY